MNSTLRGTFSLIGGTGRSGTTILQKIFAQHPNVAWAPEWRFAIDPDGLVDFFTSVTRGWSPYLYDRKVKRLRRLLRAVAQDPPLGRVYRALRRIGISTLGPYLLRPQYLDIRATKYCPRYLSLVDDLLRHLTDFRFTGSWTGMRMFEKSELLYGGPQERSELASILGEFWRQVARSVSEQQGADNYVEKNTWNILWFDKLLHLVPEARLVHIYRDPRDVVASYMRQTWTPSDPVQAAIVYRDIMQRWWAVRERVPLDSYLEVSLESLVEQSEPTLRRLCGFWGIEWDRSLLATDLSRSHSGRWKKDLSPGEQQEVQEVLRDVLHELGYE